MTNHHAYNELVASVFQLKKRFPVDSGWIELVGWDFLEAAGMSQPTNDYCSQPTKKLGKLLNFDSLERSPNFPEASALCLAFYVAPRC